MTSTISTRWRRASTGAGWQFTSSDGKIVKTIRLASGDTKLEATYALSGGVNKLFVRHGLAPDLLNLVFDGQTGLIGPTNAGGKVSLQNSNLTVQATVSVNYADAGHSNVNYNAAATDKDSAGFVSVTMRNQAQTQQIELESSATTFSFALEFDVAACTGDADGDGLNNCAELALGTNPNNPDTDGDGMNDGWETLYRNPLVPGNGNADPDGDGQSDFAESVAGTNPDNPSRVLRITSITPSGSNIVNSLWDERSYNSATFPNGIPCLLNTNGLATSALSNVEQLRRH